MASVRIVLMQRRSSRSASTRSSAEESRFVLVAKDMELAAGICPRTYPGARTMVAAVFGNGDPKDAARAPLVKLSCRRRRTSGLVEGGLRSLEEARSQRETAHPTEQ